LTLTRGTVVLYWTFLESVSRDLVRRRRENVHCSLWENDTKLNVLVFHPLWLLWPLEEWHVQNISLTSAQLAQEFLEIRIPPNTEWVVPSSENGVSRLDFEICFTLVASESRGRHVPNHISKIWIQTSNLEWELELLYGYGRRVVICLLGKLNARELVCQIRSVVVQSVSFLKRNISSPVADFNISL
jgi:hypothetical protein